MDDGLELDKHANQDNNSEAMLLTAQIWPSSGPELLIIIWIWLKWSIMGPEMLAARQ